MTELPTFLAIWWFPALVTYAMVGDLVSAKIPNWLSTALAGGFFGIAWAMAIPFEQMLMHALVSILVLVLGFSAFSRGWVGGGDAKLAAAIALWLGPQLGLAFLLLAGMIGGMIAFILTVIRMVAPSQAGGPSWARWLGPDEGMPYGVALGFSGLCLYPQTPFLAGIG